MVKISLWFFHDTQAGEHISSLFGYRYASTANKQIKLNTNTKRIPKYNSIQLTLNVWLSASFCRFICWIVSVWALLAVNFSTFICSSLFFHCWSFSAVSWRSCVCLACSLSSSSCNTSLSAWAATNWLLKQKFTSIRTCAWNFKTTSSHDHIL